MLYNIQPHENPARISIPILGIRLDPQIRAALERAARADHSPALVRKIITE
jgi:hypothetical protein